MRERRRMEAGPEEKENEESKRRRRRKEQEKRRSLTDAAEQTWSRGGHVQSFCFRWAGRSISS